MKIITAVFCFVPWITLYLASWIHPGTATMTLHPAYMLTSIMWTIMSPGIMLVSIGVAHHTGKMSRK